MPEFPSGIYHCKRKDLEIMFFKSSKIKTACIGYIVTYGWSVGSKWGASLDL